MNVQIEVVAAGSPQTWNGWTGTVMPFDSFQVNENAEMICLPLETHDSAR